MTNGSRRIALAVFLLAGPAFALPAGIYVTDQAVDTTAPTFESDLRKARKSVLSRDGGRWHVFFVAYLTKPAPGDQLNLVFYEALAKGKQEPIAYPISTKKGAKIVASDVTCSPEDALKPGVYVVKITQLVGGKEQILATTRLELK